MPTSTTIIRCSSSIACHKTGDVMGIEDQRLKSCLHTSGVEYSIIFQLKQSSIRHYCKVGTGGLSVCILSGTETIVP